MKRWILLASVIAVIVIVNPYIFDYIIRENDALYVRQLTDVDQTTIKAVSRLPNLIYVVEFVAVLGLFLYTRKGKKRNEIEN